MGVWSHEPFGNDDAADWVYELENAQDDAVLAKVFESAIENKDEYLEADDASVIIAAVEVIAKLLGKGTQVDAYTAQIDEWVNTVKIEPSPELLEKARTALDLVLSDDSELNELWGETEYYDDWRANIAALKTALAK